LDLEVPSDKPKCSKASTGKELIGFMKSRFKTAHEEVELCLRYPSFCGWLKWRVNLRVIFSIAVTANSTPPVDQFSDEINNLFSHINVVPPGYVSWLINILSLYIYKTAFVITMNPTGNSNT
jgi:hypothetical protein